MSVSTADKQPLLEVRGLRTYFHTEEGTAKAVDGVDFVVNKGETLGLVGESGCGKSVTSLSVMQLIPKPPGEIMEGQILLDGDDLLKRSDEDMRWVRGNEVAMIFQEPMTALNPVFTVGDQIMEAVKLHRGASNEEARARAIEMLELVGIPSAADRVDEYPHQLSGGMRQRVMIAIAMSCDPKLLIADEPTTALDVTIQAQILELIRDLQERRGMSVLLITHDLAVVAETTHQVAVMYAGKVVEHTTTERLFAAPKHPYTIGLFRSLPDLVGPGERLQTIPGIVPAPTKFPSGCRFRTRCPLATAHCADEEPALIEATPGHAVACHHLEEAAKL